MRKNILTKITGKKVVIIDGVKKVLVSVPMIPAELIVAKKIEQLHNIHILDISGSMTYHLEQLKKDVLKSIEKMRQGDLLSIVLLTSHDRCKILLKGIEITDNSKSMVSKLINGLGTMGCTCFSEPLRLSSEIINDLKTLCPDFYISLFTDGSPVVPWSDREEIDRCLKQLDSMKENVSVVDTIGYGNYYDSSLLLAISEATEGGKYTHVTDFEAYRNVIDESYETLRNSIRTQLPIMGKGSILFISGNNVMYNKDNVTITTLSEDTNSILFLLDEDATEITIGSEVVKISDIKGNIDDDEVEDFIYLLAKEETYKGNILGSLSLLDFIGDIGLIIKTNNAFTKEEKQNALNSIQEAIQNKDKRFLQGKESGSLGDSNAYSLVDLLSFLSTQETYLLHETFNKYTRIGVKTVQKTNNFETTKINPVLLSNIAFNEKRANISVLFTYNGLVTLNDKEKAKELGLDKIYVTGQVPAVKYNNYTIIKDGEVNIETLKLLVTQNTLNTLKTIPTLVGKGDLVLSEEIQENGFIKVELNVKALPIISRKYALDLDIQPFYDTYKEVYSIKSRKKAVRYLLKELQGDDKNSFKEFTPEQIEFLKENGLNSKLEWGMIDYKATKENVAESDTYVAKVMEFKFKGATAQPDTKKMIDAINKGKSVSKFTEVAMVDTLNKMFDKMANLTNEEKVNVLTKEFANLDERDKKLTLELNKIKLAKIITGTLWDNIIPDDKADYIFNDLQIFLKKELVPFTS